MKSCVINFSKGAWYGAGQRRLVESLKGRFDGDVLTFTDEAQVGAPTHQKAPYAFKPFALQHAVEKGYDLVLWCDSSVWAIKPIQPVFDHLSIAGHLFFYNCNAGNWCSDACLQSFGITRDQAFQIPMLMGLCMGWDMRTAKCQNFLKRWLEKATDGVTFPGSWTNKNNEVSRDSGVYGHRHDQSASSIIAHQLGMPLIIPHETLLKQIADRKKAAEQ